jgi:hypothetical protein
LSRKKRYYATVEQCEVNSCISRGYRGAELKDAVRLVYLVVGRPKESCGGAIDEWH